jgi:hypothetical protein
VALVDAQRLKNVVDLYRRLGLGPIKGDSLLLVHVRPKLAVSGQVAVQADEVDRRLRKRTDECQDGHPPTWMSDAEPASA